MIADLMPYPAIKDSGVSWLGEVPEHWKVLKLRNVLESVTARNRPDLPLLSVVREKGVIVRDRTSNDENHNFVPDDLSNYKVVRAAQFAMNKMKAWQGSYGVSWHDGLVSPAYFVFDVSGVDEVFFHAAIRSRAYISFFAQASDGVRIGQWDLSQARMKEIPFVVPAPLEQIAIVRFLDHVDRRTRRYIRAKQMLIKLLEEQKQAIIHRAVTRGLDPNVHLKPSGIPWIGDIPAHWEVLRSKYIYREVDDRSAAGEETHLSMSQKFGLIPSSQIEERRLVSESYVGAKLCEKGDLVLNRLKAHLGVFARASERGLVSPDYTVFRPVGELDGRFFEAVYRTPACRVELRQRAKGIVQGFWRLYTDDFYDIRIPVPPLDEQKHIMAQLEIDLSDANDAMIRLEREIELVREYRIRLIADVVTGKLDVREAAAKLPDEIDEPEEIDDSEAPTESDEETADSNVDTAAERAEA